MDSVPEMWALIDAHPLGHWVCPTTEGLSGHHIPWVLERPSAAEAAAGRLKALQQRLLPGIALQDCQ